MLTSDQHAQQSTRQGLNLYWYQFKVCIRSLPLPLCSQPPHQQPSKLIDEKICVLVQTWKVKLPATIKLSAGLCHISELHLLCTKCPLDCMENVLCCMSEFVNPAFAKAKKFPWNFLRHVCFTNYFLRPVSLARWHFQCVWVFFLRFLWTSAWETQNLVVDLCFFFQGRL